MGVPRLRTGCILYTMNAAQITNVKCFGFVFRTNMAVNLADKVGGVALRVEFNPLYSHPDV